MVPTLTAEKKGLAGLPTEPDPAPLEDVALYREVSSSGNWTDEFNRLAGECSVVAPAWSWDRTESYHDRLR
jgi:hypothetical protein